MIAFQSMGPMLSLAAVLEGSRLVEQLLPIDRVPLCHLQMRSRDARHLLPVLPALVLPQQIRLIDQLLSLGEVLHAVDLVALALGDVDEVGTRACRGMQLRSYCESG